MTATTAGTSQTRKTSKKEPADKRRSAWGPAKWLGLALLGTFVGVIVGATGLQGVVNRSVSHTVWFAQHLNSPTAKPNCADQGYYSEITATNSNAIAYYTEPDGSKTYPDNLTSDNDRRTGWVEDGFQKHGKNRDVISWNFKKKSHIRLICVRNGLTDTPASFNNTGQVQSLHVDCDPPVTSHTFPELRSSGAKWQAYQNLRVDCQTDHVIFLITSIYPAQDGSNTDQVSISDVRFFG